MLNSVMEYVISINAIRKANQKAISRRYTAIDHDRVNGEIHVNFLLFLYSQLVEDEFDFVGQIAYSLYKQDKVNCIEDYFIENGGEITQPELENFHKMSCKAIVTEANRRKAEDILGTFINDALGEVKEEIKINAINNHRDFKRNHKANYSFVKNETILDKGFTKCNGKPDPFSNNSINYPVSVYCQGWGDKKMSINQTKMKKERYENS